MNFKKFNNKYIIRIDKGEEIVEFLKKFCKDNDIKAGAINGIGTASKANIGFFDLKTKQYINKEYEGAFEITSLIGNISLLNDDLIFGVGDNLAKVAKGEAGADGK